MHQIQRRNLILHFSKYGNGLFNTLLQMPVIDSPDIPLLLTVIDCADTPV